MTLDVENLRRERAPLDEAFKAINKRYGAGTNVDANSIKAFFGECLSAARLYPDAASMYAASGIYGLLNKASSSPLVISDPAKSPLFGMFGKKAKFAHAPYLKTVLALALAHNSFISEVQVIATFAYYVATHGMNPPDGMSMKEYQAIAITSAWMAYKVTS